MVEQTQQQQNELRGGHYATVDSVANLFTRDITADYQGREQSRVKEFTAMVRSTDKATMDSILRPANAKEKADKQSAPLVKTMMSKGMSNQSAMQRLSELRTFVQAYYAGKGFQPSENEGWQPVVERARDVVKERRVEVRENNQRVNLNREQGAITMQARRDAEAKAKQENRPVTAEEIIAAQDAALARYDEQKRSEALDAIVLKLWDDNGHDACVEIHKRLGDAIRRFESTPQDARATEQPTGAVQPAAPATATPQRQVA